jgi:CDP-glycerol glycerophosphotransferase
VGHHPAIESPHRRGISRARDGFLQPDVTVVLIAYNDAVNLPTAVRSVLNQTLANLELIIVDDGSTDRTGQVAEELAATDARARVVHLPLNSGGCSAPRNAGLEHAQAPYVMFLDSDDEYERHACKNMLAAAERTSADLVSGLLVRENIETGAERRWWEQLYEQRAAYEGIQERPEQLYDTTSTNKLYRREFLTENGIRFQEGLHYEDLLFTTEAYCSAKRIATIPNVVYRWKHTRVSESLSITNRRHQIENYQHRLDVHRRIDEYLAAHGLDDLKSVKDRKFVSHDLRLYLDELLLRDGDFQLEFMRLSRNYLRTIDERTLAACRPLERIAVFLILNQDLRGAFSASDYLKRNGAVSTDLARDGERVYWTADHLETPEGRSVLDVTELGLHLLPWPRMRLFNRVTRLERHGPGLRLAGEVINQLGLVQDGDALQAQLVLNPRGGGRAHAVPVDEVRTDGSRITWSAVFDVARQVHLGDHTSIEWDLRLELVWRGLTNVAPLYVLHLPGVDGRRLRVRSRFADPNVLAAYTTVNGNLAFKPAYAGRFAVAAARATARARRTLPYRAGRRLAAVPRSKRLKTAVYRRVFTKLPVKRGTVVFESNLGKQFGDSPRYVYEALTRAGNARHVTWSYATDPQRFPRTGGLVRRNSWRYYYALARAEVWVDNQGFPRQFTKRPETTYIQTWHGTPLKKMGFDEPQLGRMSPEKSREHQAMIDRWDHLVVPSEYFVDTFVRSYKYRGNLVRAGLPRNDPLVAADEADLRALKDRLELPHDRRIVLYAPTFRDDLRRRGEPFELELDLDLMRELLVQDYFFLIRTHYLDRLKLHGRHTPIAANVSNHDDVTELMLASDLLVTDYSSIMFDYANLRRPMIFFTYDHDEYVSIRGTYFTLRDEAPGPVVSTNEELAEALRSADNLSERYRDRYDAFVARYCEYQTGTASEEIVSSLFARRS